MINEQIYLLDPRHPCEKIQPIIAIRHTFAENETAAGDYLMIGCNV